jgi:subtilisin-like proprotein convertase family protein
MSPLEKYDLAFNGWKPAAGFDSLKPFDADSCGAAFDKKYYDGLGPAAKYQSSYKGNAKARDGVDSDGDGKVDECDDFDGVETWWGMCHAWVPASILQKEPQKAVTHNGVTFEVGDIKALLITQYDQSSAFMLGGRCNEKEVKRDEHGRLTESQCRDTNAGAFHVVLTNLLGRYKRSFAEDRTYDYEVWNQPMYDYEILSQQEVTAQAAMTALGQPNATKYSYNDAAKRFYKVKTKVRYLKEPAQTTTFPLVPKVESSGLYLGSDTYDYILELDDAGKILGGEWMNYSQTTHPDFLWLPIAAQGGNPHVDLAKVRMLLEMATGDSSDGVRVETFKNDTDVAVPDNTPAGINSTITITEDIPIGSLDVAVDIKHGYRGDLVVALERDGKTVTLHNRADGGADDLVKTFPVSGFSGMSAKGTWRLKVSDHAKWDKGTLRGWSLTVSTKPAKTPQEFWASNLPAPIPDNNAAGVSRTIPVSVSGTVGSLQVHVDVKHSYIGDLKLELVHGGVTKVLHQREGGSSDDIRKTYTVDGFGGALVAGDWTLRVSDHSSWDSGKLEAFSIIVTPQ